LLRPLGIPRRVEIEKLAVFGDVLLKAKRIVAGRVRFNRRRHAEHSAKVVEMLGVSRAFLAGKLRPFRF
jgi:hypothetical protein